MNEHLRLAVLEWSRRSAAGDLPGLDWVDSTVFARGVPFTMARTARGLRFRHIPFGMFLPEPMVRAAQGAQRQGEPTLLEALQLLFARAEWLVASRSEFWTPYGPVPPLLASLVEAYGVDAEIHGNDAEVLSRAVAHLPSFYPHRGSAERAGVLLEESLGLPVDVDLDQSPAAAHDEVFTCRSARWHARHERRPQRLVIERGMVHARGEARIRSNAEDVLVGWVPGDRFPHHLLRLLPTWASVRIHGATGS